MTGRMTILLTLLLATAVTAQDIQVIPLPKPDTTGGKPLMQVLKDRQSTRDFSADTIPLPVLSNLLWAACGVNRAESGKRTAPSAMNWQEIDVYVTTARGVFRYDSKGHSLQQIMTEDIREKTGSQPFVKEVPVNLLYVADYAKANRGSEEDKSFYAAADAGFISENVYLFCASEGLATVVRGSVDRELVAKAMNLRPDQKVILAQSVGYPKK
ncbi:nitroreductase [candidate division GN15 bacterium]|uniref:Nitroreductase n=1 Tax=candidate division GN15 bacterium TaxID=2072418 RepID=A0A855X882_9BACT|nr:MAG: nitroreductase [candidate division GN15 bacterium]